jgi:hypothetical protein
LLTQLRTWAQENDMNMNSAIVFAIESLLVAGPRSLTDQVAGPRSRGRLVNSPLAVQAIVPGRNRGDALLEIKDRAAERGDNALAGVLASFSAAIATNDAEIRQAVETITTAAAECADAGYPEIAEALFGQVLEIDPSNEDASLWIGQKLCRRAEEAGNEVELYQQALRHLDRFPWLDTASLEQAWANYFIARASADESAVQHWTSTIQVCIQRQLVNASPAASKNLSAATSKKFWAAQMDRLHRAGLDSVVQELNLFADKQGLWSRVVETTTTANRLIEHITADPRAKSEILSASGIDDRDWTPAIKQLLEEERVIRTGTKRGAKYTRAAELEV